MNVFLRHFPNNKKKWKIYYKTLIPMMMGSILFALNSFVDNFMVGHIEQGQASLGAVNFWTSILMGFFIGTAATGSVVAAQFYHAKQFTIFKEICRYRFYLCIIASSILATIAWVHPDLLINVFVKRPTENVSQYLPTYLKKMENARLYIKIIAIQWLLISLTFNYGNQLKEIGLGKYGMMWGFGTLTANITLNSILMYGVGMGVDGAAWASVAGRIVALTWGFSVVVIKKIPIGFKPWTIFQVSFATRLLLWKRGIYGLSVFTVMFAVIFRSYFFANGLAENQVNFGKGVTGLSIVALTSGLVTVFTSTYAGVSSMAANFVGSELGKGNLKQARLNSDQLKGFNFTASICMAFLLMIFATCLPYMSFFSTAKNVDNDAQLLQVSYALYVISFFYPITIWFYTSYRNANSGGIGSKFAIIDWIVSYLQLGWLAIIVFFIVPESKFMQEWFYPSYSLFFVSSAFKLLLIESLYYKYKWLNSLTENFRKS